MEDITYDMILKYLTKDKHIFITDKHNCNYNFFNKFKTILTNEYYRYGIITFDYKKNNISFWASLLTLLNDDYLINIDDLSLITEYKNSLIDNHSKKISNFLKKYEKNDFREYFKLNPDIIIIQYVVDILNINIIIIDLHQELENIYVVYKNDIMNPFNDTIILANYQNYWEPIMKSDKKKFNYNDDIIKTILNEDIKYYSQENVGKIFSYSINTDIKKKNKSINISINSQNSSDLPEDNLVKDSETVTTDIKINTTKSKLERTKKEDLIKILVSFNIEYPKKNTNNELIDLIISNNLK